MDHKDLLNSVIANMTNSQETTAEVPTDDLDNSGYIQLSLCTGETFLVDPNNLDWDNAISQIAHLQDNMVALRNIQYNLLQAAGNIRGQHRNPCPERGERSLERHPEG